MTKTPEQIVSDAYGSCCNHECDGPICSVEVLNAVKVALTQGRRAGLEEAARLADDLEEDLYQKSYIGDAIRDFMNTRPQDGPRS